MIERKSNLEVIKVLRYRNAKVLWATVQDTRHLILGTQCAREHQTSHVGY